MSVWNGYCNKKINHLLEMNPNIRPSNDGFIFKKTVRNKLFVVVGVGSIMIATGYKTICCINPNRFEIIKKAVQNADYVGFLIDHDNFIPSVINCANRGNERNQLNRAVFEGSFRSKYINKLNNHGGHLTMVLYVKDDRMFYHYDCNNVTFSWIDYLGTNWDPQYTYNAGQRLPNELAKFGLSNIGWKAMKTSVPT